MCTLLSGLNRMANRHDNNVMHAKPDLREFLKWLIARSGSVITDVITLCFMNLKILLFCLLAYVGASAFLLLLHFAFSRNGMGNEFMIFGFPLIPLFLAGLKSTKDELSRADVIAIAIGCFVISAISMPIHYLAPERLLNPYSGPIGTILQLPILCIMYVFYTYIVKPRRTQGGDRDA